MRTTEEADMSQGKIRTSKMGEKYVMRKVLSIKLFSTYGGRWYKIKLECGHEEQRYGHPSINMLEFMLSQPEMRDKAKLGCFECGKAVT